MSDAHGTAADDLVVTSAGVLSAAGVGLDAHLSALTQATAPTAGRSLRTFQPGPHLSDRRLAKSVSATDVVGLVGIEELRRDPSFDGAPGDGWRRSLFVGGPPAYVNDNEPYLEAMAATRSGDGRCSLREFGRTCMSTRPTTLLIGLPNNVLCYGALLLNARGPNSNYNEVETSGHAAMLGAAKALRRGRADYAIAGGFSVHSTEPNATMFRRLGLARRAEGAPGTDMADGAVFLALETRRRARARGAQVLANIVSGALGADALGPLRVDPAGCALAGAIQRALRTAGVSARDIGLVMAHASGIADADRGEVAALEHVFAEAPPPAVATTTRLFGNLMEAGGLIEIALVEPLSELREVPSILQLAGYGTTSLDGARPYVLILRSSAFGTHACIVVRRGR